MSKSERSENLTQAVELLKMLEQFSKTLSSSDFKSGEIAWEGIIQSLKSVRSKIEGEVSGPIEKGRERTESVEGPGEEAAFSDSEQGNIEDFTVRSSIARRIKKVPQSNKGQVRELVEGSLEKTSKLTSV